MGVVPSLARLGDVRDRAHLDQPLHTDRRPLSQATIMGEALLSALVMSAAAHLEQPCTPTGGHSSRRST